MATITPLQAPSQGAVSDDVEAAKAATRTLRSRDGGPDVLPAGDFLAGAPRSPARAGLRNLLWESPVPIIFFYLAYTPDTR